MIIVNFGHPLTDRNIEEIRTIVGNDEPIQIVNVPVQADRQRDIWEVAHEAIDRIQYDSRETYVVNPPGLAILALAIVAGWDGRFGEFPKVLNIRPVAGQTAPTFEVAQIIQV